MLPPLLVDAAAAGERLDRWLVAHLPELSRSRLAQLIEDGHVRVDGRTVKPSARLRAGAAVQVDVPAPEPAEPEAEALDFGVLYEDEDLLVVDKPAGMVVHPAAGVHSGTLVNALLHHVKDLSGVGGVLRPGIVHRLDRDTSGALVVAKNDFALARLQRAFVAREVEKRYLALAHGAPPEQATIDTPFGRHPVDRVRMTGKRMQDEPGVRRAVTHFRVVRYFGTAAARLEVNLETGRTHQIRVHLAESGHPLLADETYGGARRDRRAPDFVRRAAAAVGRQALHAHVLAFAHPRTGVPIRCEAPVPADLARALEILEEGAG